MTLVDIDRSVGNGFGFVTVSDDCHVRLWTLVFAVLTTHACSTHKSMFTGQRHAVTYCRPRTQRASVVGYVIQLRDFFPYRLQ